MQTVNSVAFHINTYLKIASVTLRTSLTFDVTEAREILSLQEGSVGKGVCCKTWLLEWHPQKERRESTQRSSPLTPRPTPWAVEPPPHNKICLKVKRNWASQRTGHCHKSVSHNSLRQASGFESFFSSSGILNISSDQSTPPAFWTQCCSEPKISTKGLTLSLWLSVWRKWSLT